MSICTYSQAHLQFAHAKPQSRNCKRACPFANAFLPTLKTNFFSNSSASIERFIDSKRLIMNKAQHTTRGKKHCADSAYLNNITFNQRLSGLINLCSEMRNDFLPLTVSIHY